MQQVDLVCLCAQYDIKAMFGPGFAAYPWLHVLRPAEVSDPRAIRYALAFRPGPADFDPYPNLELVCSAGAGVDGLLSHPGLPPDMPVSRMLNPDQAQMMAGFAAWYVLGQLREMWGYPAQQEAGLWQVINHREAADFPVALLGFGAMGRACAAPLRQLGFPLRAWASRAREEDGVTVRSGQDGLAQTVAGAMAVINLLPLTGETRAVLSAPLFAGMGAGSILIQLGRGGHLVEADLLAALETGRPAKAAIDVTEVEPLPRDHIFWRHPQVMLTPHAASESDPAKAAEIVATAIRAFEAGDRPAGWVDRTKGY